MLSFLFNVVPCKVDVGCIDGYYCNYSWPQLMFWVDVTLGAYIQKKNTCTHKTSPHSKKIEKVCEVKIPLQAPPYSKISQRVGIHIQQYITKEVDAQTKNANSFIL